MDKQLGTIVALEGSPSTSDFSFVINSGADVKKGQYVQVESGKDLVFGFVAEIVRANRYFEQAESVAEYEKSGRIADAFPSDGWEYVLAQVRILGNRQEGKFVRTFTPPRPGAAVSNADDDVLREFLGFDGNGLHMGEI